MASKLTPMLVNRLANQLRKINHPITISPKQEISENLKWETDLAHVFHSIMEIQSQISNFQVCQQLTYSLRPIQNAFWASRDCFRNINYLG